MPPTSKPQIRIVEIICFSLFMENSLININVHAWVFGRVEISHFAKTLNFAIYEPYKVISWRLCVIINEWVNSLVNMIILKYFSSVLRGCAVGFAYCINDLGFIHA